VQNATYQGLHSNRPKDMGKQTKVLTIGRIDMMEGRARADANMMKIGLNKASHMTFGHSIDMGLSAACSLINCIPAGDQANDIFKALPKAAAHPAGTGFMGLFLGMLIMGLKSI
jgi:hypothetical protein